jgi:hypothetical protein
MPSKKRYILHTPEQKFRGSQVVAMLCKVAQSKLFDLKLPDGWVKFNTQKKLEFLTKFLPARYKLIILQEPKWTRKKKSKYLQILHEPVTQTKKLEQQFYAQVNYINDIGGLVGNVPD